MFHCPAATVPRKKWPIQITAFLLQCEEDPFTVITFKLVIKSEVGALGKGKSDVGKVPSRVGEENPELFIQGEYLEGE